MTELELINLITQYLPEGMLGVIVLVGVLYLLRIKKEPDKISPTDEVLRELKKVNENLDTMATSMNGMSKQFSKWITESALARQRIEDIWKKIED